MAKIKLTQPVLNYDGTFLMGDKVENGRPVLDQNNRPIKEVETLRNYLIVVLSNIAKDEEEAIPIPELSKRYQLSKKLYEHNEVKLADWEKDLLKERAGKVMRIYH
jgi:hypothetical protein